MNNVDTKYIELCTDILDTGNVKGDRTGTGTISKFGKRMSFDLSEGFPLLTTKSVHFKSVVGELLWFLKGETNIAFLQEHKIKIWDGFADETGSVGRMYGAQWRDWYVDAGYWEDQIENLIKEIKGNPDSRRMVVSAWNAGELPDASMTPVENVKAGNPALPPCHVLFQCYVVDGKLSMQMYQRSVDCFLGLPFNIASYALLTHMLAQVCSLEVGELIWIGGDCHIYSNHTEQVETQIDRFNDGYVHKLPVLSLNKEVMDIDNFTFDDIELLGYKNSGKLTGKVAI